MDLITEQRIIDLANANPNLGGIWTDERQADVFWGLKNGSIQPIPAILCEPRQDMFQFWRDWLNDKTGFRCFSTVQPGGTGYDAVYAANYLLSGEKIDPAALGGMNKNSFIYDYPIITNDNLDEWLGKS